MNLLLSRISRIATVLFAILIFNTISTPSALAQGDRTYFPPGQYRIIVMANARLVHVDGSNDRLASTRYQVLDNYSLFNIAPAGNGDAQVIVAATGRHWHVDGGGDQLLSTRYQPLDAFTRFRFYKMHDGLGGYRIQVVATGRFLHEDGLGDRLMSTRYQVNDPFSRFAIIPYRP